MPKIYVACLASYNNGLLHGAWIDADQDAEAIQAAIQKVLSNSKFQPAEDYAIHDYEGFGKIKLSESESIETVAALAKALDEHGTAFEFFYSNEGIDDVSDAIEAFEERFSGEYKSAKAWAEEYLEDTGALSEIPENLRYYFDFEKYARDAQLGGDMTFFDNGHNSVFVFQSN
jgi:antirestriction protein